MTEAPTMRLAAMTTSAEGAASGLRAAMATRSMLHLYTALEADGGAEGSELAVIDDRLRRREQLLHQLALERSRRRRRSA